MGTTAKTIVTTWKAFLTEAHILPDTQEAYELEAVYLTGVAAALQEGVPPAIAICMLSGRPITSLYTAEGTPRHDFIH